MCWGVTAATVTEPLPCAKEHIYITITLLHYPVVIIFTLYVNLWNCPRRAVYTLTIPF